MSEISKTKGKRLKAKVPGAERKCVYCGCTELQACSGSCFWVVVHPKTPTGVCSRCDYFALTHLLRNVAYSNTGGILDGREEAFSTLAGYRLFGGLKESDQERFDREMKNLKTVTSALRSHLGGGQ